MRRTVFSGRVSRLQGEVFVVGCFKDVRPLKGAAGEIDWLFAGLLSHLFVQNKMTGVQGETALLATQGKISIDKVLLVGLGEKEKYDFSRLQELMPTVNHQLKKIGSHETILELLGVEECGLEAPKALGLLIKCLQDKEEEKYSFYVRSAERARELQQRLHFLPQHVGVE